MPVRVRESGQLVSQLEHGLAGELAEAIAGTLCDIAEEVVPGARVNFDSVLKRCGLERCDAIPEEDF